MKIYLVLGSGVATGMLAAQGCDTKTIDPLHCAVNDGDAYCARQFDDDIERFCQRGIDECYTSDSQYGCVEQRPTNACYSPCGGRQNIDENGECVAVEDSSTGTSTSEGTDTETSTGSSSESSSTTGPMPCVSDDECTDEAAPFCGVSGECGTCTDAPDPDAACAGDDPLLPLCVDDTCVACTDANPLVCDEQFLLCDGTTNTCVPCVAHTECPSGACELDVGRCFPEDFVVHVDGDGGADYPSVTAAVDAVEGTHGVIVVHEYGMMGETPYVGTVTIDADKTIALLAAPGENPIILGTGGSPGLSVQGAATILYMDGLTVAGNTMGRGLSVNDAFAWLDRSHIVDNNGGGILAEAGAELTVRNCFVGQDVSNMDSIVVTGATTAILYTTVIAGDGGLGQSRAIVCDGASDVVIRNSLVVAVDDVPELDCSEADVSYTATETAVPGTGNQALGNLVDGWFVNETNDFHLDTPPAMLATTARWTTGDPPTDIDGDLRPATNGDPDYAGADVPM